MARRRNKTKSTHRSTRVTAANSKPRLRSSKPMQALKLLNNLPAQDARRYSPQPITPRTTRNTTASITIAKKPSQSLYSKKTTSRKTFVAPQHVITCVRRKIRNEVMHALNHSGKSGQKQPRRNQFSNISCK
ncbi:MAG: hypothetical protein KTR28_02215 [Micavibrio sp.]|nr:hypothetical protein [Micavibrio sp.]